VRPLITILWAAVAASASAAEVPAKAPRVKENLACTYETSTGSHIKRRVCMTASERKERQQRDQERVRQAQDRTFKTNVDP
jgi:hypothetical protein